MYRRWPGRRRPGRGSGKSEAGIAVVVVRVRFRALPPLEALNSCRPQTALGCTEFTRLTKQGAWGSLLDL